MSAISTHVLDAVLGKPAAGIAVLLERQTGDGAWLRVAESCTDVDGRCARLASVDVAATVRLTFAVAAYFDRLGRKSIYPEIVVAFLADGEGHYHIPLLLSDNSYTTYRGS